MSDTHETIADIIAEMLGARTEFPFVYLIGEPDTPEVVDFNTKEIVEPRKINIRRVTVKELANRLEAAHKREKAAVGDCAKLREAVIGLRDRISMFYKSEWIPYDEWEGANDDADAALAAPPRNCDRLNVDDAFEAFTFMCDNTDCRDCPYKQNNKYGDRELCAMLFLYDNGNGGKEGGAK